MPLSTDGDLRQSPGVWLRGKAEPVRTQLTLGAATVLAYAVGYPVAMIGHSAIGWGLVTLGGLLLMAFGAATVRRVHRGAERGEAPLSRPDDS